MYYCRSVKGYADHSVAFTNATKKDATDKMAWTPELKEEFMYLKDAMCYSLTYLAHKGSCYVLQTDASMTGLGAVLSVRREDGNHPIAFYSQKLLPRETQHAAATELEGLAVICAVEHFAPYLISKQFVLETDHKALIFMDSARHTNGRLARWVLRLQLIGFKISYRPGKANGNADALSRLIPQDKDDLRSSGSRGGEVSGNAP